MLVPRASYLRSLRFRSYATHAPRPPLSGLNDMARQKAEQLSKEWRGTSATGEHTKNFIGGEFVESKASQWLDVIDPVCCILLVNISAYAIFQSTQTLLTRVPETTSAEFEQAVGAASEAFKTWRDTSVITRQRFVLEYVLSQYVNCKTHVPTFVTDCNDS